MQCTVLHNTSLQYSSVKCRCADADLPMHQSAFGCNKYLTDGSVMYRVVQGSAMQCSAIQYSATRYSAVIYSAVQFSATRCSADIYSAVQFSATRCSAARYSALQISAARYSAYLESAVIRLCTRGRIRMGIRRRTN